jgi:hypothetical protein
MARRNQQQSHSLRNSGDDGKTADMFYLRKSVRDLLVLAMIASVVNVILFNTGFMDWADWRSKGFDNVWSSAFVMFNAVCIYVLQGLDR